MNDIIENTGTAISPATEAPALVFNPETGTFEAVTEVTVTDEGVVATSADVTVH